MFKFIVRLGIVGVIGFGLFAHFQNNRLIKINYEVPEVSFNQVQDLVEEGIETIEVLAEQLNNEDSEDSQDSDGAEGGMEREVEGENSINDLAVQYNLAVPFTSQITSQEAYVEVACLMVSEYYKGAPSGEIDSEAVETAILEVVDFEMDYLGYYLDADVAASAQVIDLYFGYGARIAETPTINNIKAEIAAGRPVIVPVASRKLGNPFYTGLGPLFHYLVIKGYSDDMFITNDPGTRSGENYVYDIDVVMAAMGDWNNGDPANGDKVAIFTSPQYDSHSD
ncbi:MAG: C39 family peptidase [Patescibacteria group bacterium]